MIILGIISYFLIGFIIGIVICKIKGKEWCRANDFDPYDGNWFDNNAQGVMCISTFFWGVAVLCAILFSPFFIIYSIITYTAKKLQK